MRMMNWNVLEMITEADFVKDPERYIDQVNRQKLPLLIQTGDGREVVLMGWEQYSEVSSERWE